MCIICPQTSIHTYIYIYSRVIRFKNGDEYPAEEDNLSVSYMTAMMAIVQWVCWSWEKMNISYGIIAFHFINCNQLFYVNFIHWP